MLNYFIKRETNSSAESLNSKIKVFRSGLKGVNNVSFFMFRVFKVLG
nr:transposase [Prevotella lacticifex]